MPYWNLTSAFFTSDHLNVQCAHRFLEKLEKSLDPCALANAPNSDLAVLIAGRDSSKTDSQCITWWKNISHWNTESS